MERKRRRESLTSAGPPPKCPLLYLQAPCSVLGARGSMFVPETFVNHGPILKAPSCTVTVIARKIKNKHFHRALAIQQLTASFRIGASYPLKRFQRMLSLMASAAPVLQLGLLRMRPFQYWLKPLIRPHAWCHGRILIRVNQACSGSSRM